MSRRAHVRVVYAISMTHQGQGEIAGDGEATTFRHLHLHHPQPYTLITPKCITSSSISPHVKSVSILNIPVFATTLSDAVRYVLDVCLSDSARINRCVSATGAHGLVTAQKDPAFRQTLKAFHLNLPDGVPAVWVGRLKGAHRMERCYGPDFFKAVLQESAKYPIRHYFCGGKAGVANLLKSACEKQFGNFNVVGTHCPPFRELSDREFALLGKEINHSGADIVWIGISTPKQEKFAQRLSKYTKVHFIITVGAAFDFHIGAVKQAPRFLQRLGLEWLFRLAMEPKRLFKRYVEIVPLFIYYNVREFILSRRSSTDSATNKH